MMKGYTNKVDLTIRQHTLTLNYKDRGGGNLVEPKRNTSHSALMSGVNVSPSNSHSDGKQ